MLERLYLTIDYITYIMHINTLIHIILRIIILQIVIIWKYKRNLDMLIHLHASKHTCMYFSVIVFILFHLTIRFRKKNLSYSLNIRLNLSKNTTSACHLLIIKNSTKSYIIFTRFERIYIHKFEYLRIWKYTIISLICNKIHYFSFAYINYYNM